MMCEWNRKMDTLLSSLTGALVAYGGRSARENPEQTIAVPHFDDLISTLMLLGGMTLPFESTRELPLEEEARAIHAAMQQAEPNTVRLLHSAIAQYPPEENELPQPYLARLTENLVFEQLFAEFAAGTLTPVMLRPTLDKMGEIVAAAGKFQSADSTENLSSLAQLWATDRYREKLLTKFWLGLPPREKSAVLRGPELWCVPVVALRETLGRLADAGADAPRREARHIVLNYARRLEQQDPRARRAVAAGLIELCPIIESLWPNQLPEDLSRCALAALDLEQNPQRAALLSTFLEALCRIAILRADYAGFETILTALEHAPEESEHAHHATLAKRLVAHDRWMFLVDAALANRPADPVLARLLVRDPERLLDRLAVLLGEEGGAELLPAMARVLKSIGVPVMTALDARLYESKPQRVTAAIKILAAADPDRLLRALTRAMGSWDWNIQDLAVSELSRPANTATAQTASFVFSCVLVNAHPLVVPMMIDQIGLAGESSAIPQLMEIASGEHATLRDQFVRIKAVEALGRMRAIPAAQLLHQIAERRSGITFAEPSGLRAAAQDALALIEDGPQSAAVRARFEDGVSADGTGFGNPRRYMRVPLETPLRAQVGLQVRGAHAGMARVKTISLGGAYLESAEKLPVGEPVRLEVRSGLRTIQCTAIVRNSAAGGSGVEFVHMNDQDRTTLRKLVLRKSPKR
jgi:hypothetical protein